MERQLSTLLRQVNSAMRAAFRHTLADLDLTPVQNTVLHLVAAAPGSSSAELARQAHVTPQTMHKLVAELERRGLLTLKPRAGHGRILDAHLTDEGHERLAQADLRSQAIEERMAAGLDEQQRKQLLTFLQHCAEALSSLPDNGQIPQDPASLPSTTPEA